MFAMIQVNISSLRNNKLEENHWPGREDSPIQITDEPNLHAIHERPGFAYKRYRSTKLISWMTDQLSITETMSQN